MKKFVGFMFGVLLCLPFIGWSTTRIVQNIMFNRNVEGHLKRAADANTIELAEKELAGVIAYLNESKMTSGYTSIIYQTPDEDVGFWYQNLSASLAELQKVSKEASQLEKSNILIKLRETLVDHGQDVKVTVPDGIAVFPNNVGYAVWCMAGVVLGIFGIVTGFLLMDE